jgi:hypothetical protein
MFDVRKKATIRPVLLNLLSVVLASGWLYFLLINARTWHPQGGVNFADAVILTTCYCASHKVITTLLEFCLPGWTVAHNKNTVG